MTDYPYQSREPYPGDPAGPGRPGPSVNAGRLWAGGGATAIVAALVAIVGILIARGIVGVAILSPKGAGAWGNASTPTYAILSAVVALLATGLLHVLLLTAPRATLFFAWIMVLVTAIGVVLPLGLLHHNDNRIATSALNLVIGLVITLLLVGVGHSATRRNLPAPNRP
jgi:hypothetical protein